MCHSSMGYWVMMEDNIKNSYRVIQVTTDSIAMKKPLKFNVV